MIGIFLVSEQVNLNNVFVRNHVIVDQYCMCTTLYWTYSMNDADGYETG